jgi:hypothetical protein
MRRGSTRRRHRLAAREQRRLRGGARARLRGGAGTRPVPDAIGDALADGGMTAVVRSLKAKGDPAGAGSAAALAEKRRRRNRRPAFHHRRTPPRDDQARASPGLSCQTDQHSPNASKHPKTCTTH